MHTNALLLLFFLNFSSIFVVVVLVVVVVVVEVGFLIVNSKIDKKRVRYMNTIKQKRLS